MYLLIYFDYPFLFFFNILIIITLKFFLPKTRIIFELLTIFDFELLTISYLIYCFLLAFLHF